MSSDFQTTTHGKWILTGEHAVIRGRSALVFPLTDKTLTLTYHASNQHHLDITVDMLEQDADDMRDLLQRLLRYGLPLISQSYATLTGTLDIKSTIPVGVGMGASAALCVALARWFSTQQWIKSTDEPSIARKLEHFFHGQSSGLDIAGVASSIGICFQNGITTPIHNTWSPNWRLSSCGQQGPTADCIRKVQQFWQTHPETASSLDQTMQISVEQAKQALETPYHPEKSRQKLAEAMTQAQQCFEGWGLISDGLRRHIDDLYAEGALAAKPTGSGGGGYVVSLWE